mgnify:CR=1 FL=1
MSIWYKVTAYTAHNGAGREYSKTVYMYVPNPVSALNRYKRLPGIKRHMMKRFPDVVPLSHKEINNLEERIVQENRMSVLEARSLRYFSFDITPIS